MNGEKYLTESLIYPKFSCLFKGFTYSASVFNQGLETLIFQEKDGHFSTFFCTRSILLDTEGFIA